MNRRGTVWMVGALAAVALAVVAIISIGSLAQSSRDDRVTTRRINKSGTINNSGTKDLENRESASTSGRVSAEKPPTLPVERFPIPTASSTKQLPTLEIDDAKAEARRQEFWQTLVAFAVEADLSDVEWERFLGDVSDVSSSLFEAYKPAMNAMPVRAGDPHPSSQDILDGLRDAAPLGHELAHDLDERIASWMTERQRKIYDRRLGSDDVLSSTRRLRMMGLLSPKNSPGVVSDARR